MEEEKEKEEDSLVGSFPKNACDEFLSDDSDIEMIDSEENEEKSCGDVVDEEVDDCEMSESTIL